MKITDFVDDRYLTAAQASARETAHMENERGPILTPGETTSEYRVSRSGSLFGMIASVAGIVLAVVPELLSTAQALPGVSETRYGKLIIQILGAALAIAGVIVKMTNDTAYTEGRSILKAAAARDLPPPPKI